MITVPWRPTLRGGKLGDFVETTLPQSEFDELQALYHEKGAAAFGEIRTRMDIWALFPGTTLVEQAREPAPPPVPVEARIEDEAAVLDEPPAPAPRGPLPPTMALPF